jgi:photosystem II stability/assembly factor-like uncharacterized protein
MKKIILLLFITHCSLLIAYAQFGWYQQYSGTTNNLNSICFIGSAGWIAGNNGTILKTTNSGTNWLLQSSGTPNNLMSIYFYDALTGCATGSAGTVLRTTNGGDNWYSLNTGVSVELNSVRFNPPSRIWVVGNNGVIIRTTNSGTNWFSIPCPVTNNLCDLTLITSYTVVGSGGVVLKSTNVGLNWTAGYMSPAVDLKSICKDGGGNTWICGASGKIFKSSDDGNSWVTLNTGTNSDLYSICLQNSMWVSGANGLILKTTNGGGNWFTRVSGTKNNLNSIYFANTNVGWSAGDNGIILHTFSDSWESALDGKSINTNTINAWFRNNGEFNRDPITFNAGFEWPKGTGKTARYSAGPWIGARVENDTLVAVAEYDGEYLPGYTDATGHPQGKDDMNYLMYKLSFGVNDSNRVHWPNALLGNSNQGAPVFYDTLSQSWKPLDYADQTMFYCYTDSYPESHGVECGSTAPLKADIKHINFAFDEPGAIGNIIYSYFTLINKNTLPWINAYFSIWSDDDLGNATDDLVGCDTLLDMGYTYNGTNHDAVYGDAPPAVATVIIKGPAYYTGNNNDTAVFCYGKTKKIKVGYKQLGISVFNTYFGGQDPANYRETYRVITGYHSRPGVFGDTGLIIINPITHQPTKFMFSGDPVTSTGWIEQGPNDQRFLLSAGPFNMNPGDTQVIVIAQIIARGTSNINSITALRQYAQVAIDNYKNCFENEPIGIKNTQNEVPTRFSLDQNYPNPFNPTTKIKFSIPLSRGARGVSVKMTIYDILGREVAIPINQEMKPGHYEVEWDGTNFASGVYFYKLETGSFVETKKMVLIK